MATRPQPIIVPGGQGGGLSSSLKQTNVGIDLDAILELTGVKEAQRKEARKREAAAMIEAARALKLLPESQQQVTAETIPGPSPTDVAGAGLSLPQLTGTQERTVGTGGTVETEAPESVRVSQALTALGQASPQGLNQLTGLLFGGKGTTQQNKIFSKKGASGELETMFVDINNPQSIQTATEAGFQPHVSGGLNIQNIIGGEGKADKQTVKKLNEDANSLNENISQVKQLSRIVEDDFLTFQGQTRAFVAKQLDKAGASSQEQRDFLSRFSVWDALNRQMFNAYRKKITGAAAALPEIKDLQKAIPSKGDSPTTYRAKIADMELNLLALQRYNAVLADKKLTAQQAIDSGLTIRQFKDEVISERNAESTRAQSQQPTGEIEIEIQGNKAIIDGQEIPIINGRITLPDGRIMEVVPVE